MGLLHTRFCEPMCRAPRSAEHLHTCTVFLHYVIQPAPLALFPSSAQIASFGWTLARIPYAPAFAMGRAQRQLRQSQRPGQQNRVETVETPASDETVEVEVEVETDEEEPRRAPVSGARNDMGGTATQLSPSELRILDYMVWHTHKPPPKTVFLRPYIEEVRNASSSRPPLTADGQDEMLEARTMPIDPRGRPDDVELLRPSPPDWLQHPNTGLAPRPPRLLCHPGSSPPCRRTRRPPCFRLRRRRQLQPLGCRPSSLHRRQEERASCLQSRSRRSVRLVPPKVMLSRVLSSCTR